MQRTGCIYIPFFAFVSEPQAASQGRRWEYGWEADYAPICMVGYRKIYGDSAEYEIVGGKRMRERKLRTRRVMTTEYYPLLLQKEVRL
jgi:hypothetical protein